MTKKDLSYFFRQCFYKRLDAQDFHELLVSSKRWDYFPADLVNNLLNCAYGFCLEDDPLITSYFQIIARNGLASIPDFVGGLALRWQKVGKVKNGHVDQYVRRTSLLLRDIVMFVQTASLSENDCRTCLILSSRWLRSLALALSADLHRLSESQSNVLASVLGFLLLALIRKPTGDTLLTAIEAGKRSPLKIALQQAVDVSMGAFPNISMQLMSETQRYPHLLETVHDSAADGNVAALAFEENISAPTIMPTRQADFVLLYNLLASSKTIDDGAIHTFLSTRHNGDAMTAITDLLYGFFDAMTKPIESANSNYLLQCQTFLLSRLPSIMSLLCAFQSLSTETSLADIWNHVNSISRPDLLPLARQFLHTCALYHLITPETVATLVDPDAETSYITGLERKDNLVQKVHENASRGPRLVEELVKNDGNALALSLAIVEIMHGYCQNRQTELLKDMSNALIRKPGTLQAIAMFVQPSSFLAPMCTVLDEWNWQDINGESQPVYEEFGSVLLLLITTKQKLNLTNVQMGIRQSDGFVARYLSFNSAERDLSQLSNDEQQYLGDWINALYVAGVLSDDLTTKCSAQEFHILVPTLLRQSATAFQQEKLQEEQLRQGLEYLLEPSLLPALPSAFAWLASFAPSDPKVATIIIQVLTKAPGQTDSSEIHATIMSMASALVRRSLGATKDDPQYAEMLGAIGTFPPCSIVEPATAEELSLWATAEGGVRGSFQRAMTDLLIMPSQGLYHQSLVKSAQQIHGPEVIIHDLISLLVQFSSDAEFHHLLDLIATFVVTTDRPGITLRNQLQLSRLQLPSLLKRGERLFAEALIHLSQRVELYGNALTTHPASLDSNLMIPAVDIANINLDDAPMPMLDVQQRQQQQQNLPQDDLSGENMEEMLNQAAAMGTVDELDANMNDTDMFDFGTDTFDLGNLDSVDFDSF